MRMSFVFFMLLCSFAVVSAADSNELRADKKFAKKLGNVIERQIDAAKNRGDIVVSPQGPKDGGDFGKFTKGTKTSGLQEAYDFAKKTGRDLYIVGGNWTVGKSAPVTYILEETLRIPCMQNFRSDSGIALIWYVKETGDAIVIDSQMSCFYRFGLLKSQSKGATVRFKPSTAGPDRFKVVTAVEFHASAIIGGGGAWPSGEHFNDKINPQHQWIGAGLFLDGSEGSIDGNKFSIIELVGCNIGLYLNEKCTNNWVDAPNIHLCKNAVQLGDPGITTVRDNRINASMHCQGIEGAVGARIFGQDNLLALSASGMSPGGDIVFEADARDNLVTAVHILSGITNRATVPTNRVIAGSPAGYSIETPAFPAASAEVINSNPYIVAISIVSAGNVSQWTLTDAKGQSQDFTASLFAGQSIILDPGDKVKFNYSQPPTWRWRALR